MALSPCSRAFFSRRGVGSSVLLSLMACRSKSDYRQAYSASCAPSGGRLLNDRRSELGRGMVALEAEQDVRGLELIEAREELHREQRPALRQVIVGAARAHGERVVDAHHVGRELVRLIEGRD